MKQSTVIRGAHNPMVVQRGADVIINVQVLDHLARIAISGRFDFRAHLYFDEACAPLLHNVAVHVIEIDMSKVDYMDSAALGMLLMLRERAAGTPIVLANASGVASRLLEIANFDKFFSIGNTH